MAEAKNLADRAAPSDTLVGRQFPCLRFIPFKATCFKFKRPLWFGGKTLSDPTVQLPFAGSARRTRGYSEASETGRQATSLKVTRYRKILLSTDGGNERPKAPRSLSSKNLLTYITWVLACGSHEASEIN